MANSSAQADEKISKDLSSLTEQIELCKQMISQAGGKIDRSNDALLGVIGFLEACEQRMIELVESAAQGSLQSDTLMKSLEVHDNLIKVLAVCSGEAKADFPPSGSASAAAKSVKTLDLNDLILDDSTQNESSPTLKGPLKSDPSDMDDLFGSIPIEKKQSLDPLTSGGGKKPTKSDDFDEFDAFLNDRASSSKNDDIFGGS